MNNDLNSFIEQKNQNLKDKNYGHNTDTSKNILLALGILNVAGCGENGYSLYNEVNNNE